MFAIKVETNTAVPNVNETKDIINTKFVKAVYGNGHIEDFSQSS